jgi:hypothetical protein
LGTVQYGADEDKNDGGKKPLLAATKDGNIDVTRSFLERGVNINGCDANDSEEIRNSIQGEEVCHVVRV